MSILYDTQPDAVLSKAAEAFKVALKGVQPGIPVEPLITIIFN